MIPLDPPRAVFLEKASSARVLPVSCEIVADSETPVSAFAKLCGEAPSFLFESAEQNDQVGRYSFLGFGAKASFTATGKTITIQERGATRSFEASRDPLDELEKWMAPYRVASDPAIAPFLGGAVGYLGYDCIRWFEPTISPAPKDELGIPDMFFMVTETVVVFDHRRRRIRIVANVFPGDGDPGAAYDAATARIEGILEKLRRPLAFDPVFPAITPPAAPSSSNTTREEYHAMVHRAQEYIRAGDIFQIVLAQRFETEFTGDALDLYRALRFVNPSPYMFCLRCPGG
ncbi:MAG: chorismate-binding protein, partial [Terrimicrobiaceae bacterium]